MVSESLASVREGEMATRDCPLTLTQANEVTKAPVKRSKLFTQQHTTFVYHLLHVVACCCLGQWSNASNILRNIVQLYNLLWIVRLKYLIAHRGIIRRNLLTNIIQVKVDMKRKFLFSHMKVHEKQE